jgi:hypothetical protein
MRTVPVTCTAIDQSGNPLAGGRFRFTLSTSEIDNGLVSPEPKEGTADENGVFVVNLWPNELGVNGSNYRVQCWNPDTGKKYLDAICVVPNSPCRLEHILQLEPYPSLDAAQQTMVSVRAQVSIAQHHASVSQSAADEASASASAASASQVASGEKEVMARASALAAKASELASNQSKVDAAQSALQAGNQAAIATAKAAESANSATSSAASATAASGHASNAQANATASGASAAQAETSKTSASASANSAANSASAASAKANASAASATQAENAANTAIAKALEAKQSADSAGLAAEVASEQAAAAAKAASVTPVGTLFGVRLRIDTQTGLPLTAPVIPPGFLLCDGSIITPDAYPELEPLLTRVKSVVGGSLIPYTDMTASASSSYSWMTGGGQYLLTNGYWSAGSLGINWLQLTFTNGPRQVTLIETHTNGQTKLNIYGSNNGVDFVKVSDNVEYLNPWPGRFPIQSPGMYSHYRLESTDPGSWFGLSGLMVYEGNALEESRPRLPGGQAGGMEVPGMGVQGIYWLIKAQP